MSLKNLVGRSLAAGVALGGLLAVVPSTFGQTPETPDPLPSPGTICGVPIPAPAAQPPAASGPVVLNLIPCFERQGNVSTIDPETYLFYIELRSHVSAPSQGEWVEYTDEIEQLILGDFRRLWSTQFLDDLVIDVQDYVFPNGVVGKNVVYDMEERQRVKVVSYQGADDLDQAQLDEVMGQLGGAIRLDSFLDQSQISMVKSVIQDLLAEEGYQDVEVTHTLTEVAGGPKLINITFDVDQGPKTRINRVDFVGNSAYDDGKLQGQMKENKPRGFLGFLMGGGEFKASLFEDDAELVQSFYRNNGYATAIVGQPELRTLEVSDDGETRHIELVVPVEEGRRYRVRNIKFEGNELVASENMLPLFEIQPGDYYSQEEFQNGILKTQEVYGASGYMEFTAFPQAAPVEASLNDPDAEPLVDVTVQVQEGEQYFVNRISFMGNTTTRDNVIRREMRLFENNVFDTEALKLSVRRLNQLGYFRPLEDNADILVEPTEGEENQVDVTLSFEEQNRNQVSFGAGVSQFDGIFVQFGFQTSNFLGRGESLTLNVQTGARAKNYQIAFNEPYLFDRPISGGVDLFIRDIEYIGAYTQSAKGGNIVVGWPLANFTRMFVSYSYQAVSVRDLNEAFLDSSCLFSGEGCRQLALSDLETLAPNLVQRNPFLYDSLLIGQNGQRTISRITPSLVFNTVDQPIFPTTGRRLTAALDIAGLGGNTSFYKPRVEYAHFFRQTSRTSLGLRAQLEYLSPTRGSDLPLFERLYLGGGFSVRGYDIRSIGPSDPLTGLVLGGNKSLLLNAEYNVNISDQVRLVFFTDAGQVKDTGETFTWREDVRRRVQNKVWVPLPGDTSELLLDPDIPDFATRTVSTTGAFKSSSGIELRFFMPVLNVPFRLIFAYNGNREGVLNNNLQQEQKLRFRFDVGTTF